MSWDELRTRVAQEVTKRADVFRYRLGMAGGLDGISDSNTSAGVFFFSAKDLPERAALLKKHLPVEAEALIREADEVCHHRFRLLGYTDLDYGKEIDWHLDAVHGKRTPLIPWYKIDFLDFDVAGDHKVTWELNRHQHFVTLGKAWVLTCDEKYAQEAVSQWYAWQSANPYPMGVNWASSLEVSFRSLSWLWMWSLLLESPSLPSRFATDFQRALALSGRHIETYLSTYFSPNTHLLGEALALFFLGTLSPGTSAANRWKQRGWNILQQEALRQVRPDGLYFEQSLYYHVYAVDFFLHARLLAKPNDIEVSPGLDAVIEKMLAVVQSLSQAGQPDGFGDDDGGRLFNPRRNQALHMTDPLAIGRILYPKLKLRGPITEESIWLFGRDAIVQAEGIDASATAKSDCFPDSGLYIVASRDVSGELSNARHMTTQQAVCQQMVIDAGPQGTGRGGHGHADALSLKLSIGNRPWIVDAGTFAYITPAGERQIFRGTRAHNTLAVDGLSQSEPAGPFAWSSLPEVHADCWIPAATFTFFAGSHSGYERLAQPVRHRRFVFHLNGCFWFIRDVAEGKGSHLLETSWHFAADLEVSAREGMFTALIDSRQAPLEISRRKDHLALIPVHDPRWRCVLSQEEISPAYGIRIPAPVLRCSANVETPAEHAMLLIPGYTSDAAGSLVRLDQRSNRVESPSAAYTYEDASSSHCLIFADAQPAAQAWALGAWRSDASLLYFRVQDRRITHLVCCGASFANLHGEPVFKCDAKLQYLEWKHRRGDRYFGCSEESAVRDFREGVLTAATVA